MTSLTYSNAKQTPYGASSSKSDYTVHISDLVEDPFWDQWLAATPGGHHVQSTLWARVKALLGWRAVRITITRQHEVVAGAQLLVRPLPIYGAVAYVPKGPLLTSDDPVLAEQIVEEIHHVAKAHRVQYLILQPPDNGRMLATQLPQWGFHDSPIRAFPTATVLVDLDQDIDTILANMKSKTRYNIRKGLRNGLTVREGGEGDLATLYQILVSTSERQEFAVYDESYYVEMQRIFGEQHHYKLFVAECEGEPVSAMFAIAFGDTVLFKRGGWSGKHGNRYPNEVMHWTAIQWAKAQGYRYYNFEGIDNDAAQAVLAGNPLPDELNHSVTRFKLGFGGQVALLPEVFGYLYNPLLRRSFNTIYPSIADWPVTQKMLDYLRSQ